MKIQNFLLVFTAMTLISTCGGIPTEESYIQEFEANSTNQVDD